MVISRSSRREEWRLKKVGVVITPLPRYNDVIGKMIIPRDIPVV